MKQLTVISGKGGTGKTSFVGAFASLAKNQVLADCDVDAADLHLLMDPQQIEEHDFKALKTAKIDLEKCIKCGLCERECTFDAIKNNVVDPLLCEGCGVCDLVCPQDAVTMLDKVAGKLYVSNTRFGPLVHARLHPGEEASGKLVTQVRNTAKRLAQETKSDLIIIDGSPGIGCPVIASIGGVDLVVIVTEPTLSGLHDLDRILATAKHFNIKSCVIINKYDINEEKSCDIIEYCKGQNIPVIGKIPYDLAFTRSMIEEKTIIEYAHSNVSDIFEKIWEEVEDALN